MADLDKIISIRELAKLAGCSKSAVSMALRNHPKISAKRKAEIQRLAQKYGYTRDPMVSTLMNQLRSGRRHRTVEKLAVISWSRSPKEYRGTMKKDLFAEQWNRGIQERAESLGYEVEAFRAYEGGMTGTRLSRILHTRSIRGLILMSMPRARGHVSLNWKYFAVATTGYTILRPHLHRAIPSLSHGMMLTLRNLRRLGYQRVGFVNLLQAEDMVNEAWLASYLGYQFRVYGKIGVPPLLLKEWSSKNLSAWLEKYKIDAVVSNWPQILHQITELDYRVPRDIGFVSLDCMPGATEYAGIHQRRDVAAGMVVDLVVEQLESNRLGLPEHPKTVLVDSVWSDGPTVRPQK